MKKIKEKKDYFIILIIAVALALGLLIDDYYTMDVLITTLYFTGLACAWNIMSGYTGNLSLGHACFIGLAQYTMIILYTKMKISPWVGMILGALISMTLAVFIGVLSLRLKTFYFTLSTIALTVIFMLLATKFDGLTGGAVGITVPFKPGFENMTFQSPKAYFFMLAVLIVVVLLFTAYMSKSRFGSNLVAIREDDVAAASLGINIFKNKVIALAISSVFTALIGCVYMMYVLFIDPASAFNAVASNKCAILTIIGGAGTVFGPLIGGFILEPTEIFLRSWLGSTYQGAYLIVYGVILVCVVLFIPDGIYGTIRNKVVHARSLREEEKAEKMNTEE